MRRTAVISTPAQIGAIFRVFYDLGNAIINEGKGFVLEIKDLTKTRDQENKYHAQIRDIAEQTTLYGKVLNEESWKRLLVDAFKHDTKDDPELADEWKKFGELQLFPALNHAGFVAVGEQTRAFSSKLAAAFIEWLYVYGAEHDVDMS